eukprot:TRINITY_DN25127_c0_g1_i1.p1 TRINITY_DN25127_c0_g1~~TRINITY_DN25127_c0_g1_i1.p1  ORF type:complete len:908 (-),score=186.28 TRINITY_DN25127_c0_g1_i1:162-2792(-)
MVTQESARFYTLLVDNVTLEGDSAELAGEAAVCRWYIDSDHACSDEFDLKPSEPVPTKFCSFVALNTSDPSQLSKDVTMTLSPADGSDHWGVAFLNLEDFSPEDGAFRTHRVELRSEAGVVAVAELHTLAQERWFPDEAAAEAAKAEGEVEDEARFLEPGSDAQAAQLRAHVMQEETAALEQEEKADAKLDANDGDAEKAETSSETSRRSSKKENLDPEQTAKAERSLVESRRNSHASDLEPERTKEATAAGEATREATPEASRRSSREEAASSAAPASRRSSRQEDEKAESDVLAESDPGSDGATVEAERTGGGDAERTASLQSGTQKNVSETPQRKADVPDGDRGAMKEEESPWSPSNRMMDGPGLWTDPDPHGAGGELELMLEREPSSVRGSLSRRQDERLHHLAARNELRLRERKDSTSTCWSASRRRRADGDLGEHVGSVGGLRDAEVQAGPPLRPLPAGDDAAAGLCRSSAALEAVVPLLSQLGWGTGCSSAQMHAVDAASGLGCEAGVGVVPSTTRSAAAVEECALRLLALQRGLSGPMGDGSGAQQRTALSLAVADLARHFQQTLSTPRLEAGRTATAAAPPAVVPRISGFPGSGTQVSEQLWAHHQQQRQQQQFQLGVDPPGGNDAVQQRSARRAETSVPFCTPRGGSSTPAPGAKSRQREAVPAVSADPAAADASGDSSRLRLGGGAPPHTPRGRAALAAALAAVASTPATPRTPRRLGTPRAVRSGRTASSRAGIGVPLSPDGHDGALFEVGEVEEGPMAVGIGALGTSPLRPVDGLRHTPPLLQALSKAEVASAPETPPPKTPARPALSKHLLAAARKAANATCSTPRAVRAATIASAAGPFPEDESFLRTLHRWGAPTVLAAS